VLRFVAPPLTLLGFGALLRQPAAPTLVGFLFLF
jgi:hypothetical protein